MSGFGFFLFLIVMIVLFGSEPKLIDVIVDRLANDCPVVAVE